MVGSFIRRSSKGQDKLAKSKGQGRWFWRQNRSRLPQNYWCWGLMATLLVATSSGCSQADAPTRTPVPTFTMTPPGVGAVASTPEAAQAAPTNTVVVAMPTATETLTPIPPPPTDTPTPQPTQTPLPTATLAPTATPTPVPSATPSLVFDLETAEKHPTVSLAPNVVRVFLYVADQDGVGLPGYSLRVLHNGAELPVDKVSEGGLPGLTRGEPSPYTRFTNLNVIFVEAQAGTWIAQLIDGNGSAVGPAAQFELTADEVTRELYVRYRMQ